MSECEFGSGINFRSVIAVSPVNIREYLEY